ncbi:MAG: nuclear transport factor 2 family protein [Melioribacteraceae bacterium]|nr:nuclear transport factor 2 family protein [Melioribacteraceae bacterium]MCF8354044.1 nuclear transport factor 2 family protein [Melioribacteraceae bacterium]MCF8392275.1 nuclear transport factor 2 family protein [Melioribacteraceae bacterium]MCF8417607.1 nuclear transport factor 2 family protein [Melioribacteraceae bacterium]
MRLLTIIFLALLIFSSCKKEEINMENEIQLLIQTDNDFSTASKELGAAAAFKKFLTKDALQFPGGADVLTGVESIYSSMLEDDSTYSLTWKPQHAEVSNSGDMGWTWGYYKLTIKESGQNRFGKYLNVWRKSENGKWKVAADIGSPGPDRDKL